MASTSFSSAVTGGAFVTASADPGVATILPSRSGAVVTNQGTVGFENIFNLPPASAGISFEFIVQTNTPQTTKDVSAITSNVTAITSLTSVGTTATGVASGGIYDQNQYRIVGATPDAYNGTYTITIPDPIGAPTTFTYTFAGCGDTPASGTLTMGELSCQALSTNHGLLNGATVTVAGASPAEYNGTFAIQVYDPNSFYYLFGGSSDGTASGTMTATTPLMGVQIWTPGYTSDTIRLGADVTDVGTGYVRSTTPGAVLRLIAINDVEWVATHVISTWSVINPPA